VRDEADDRNPGTFKTRIKGYVTPDKVDERESDATPAGSAGQFAGVSFGGGAAAATDDIPF
jgi:hypothetical protein